MKKAIKRLSFTTICFTLCIIILFSGCQSEEGKALDVQILAIGEVTDGSLKDIEAAEKLYQGLSEKEQKRLKNRQILFDSRDAYSQLQADKVIRLIETLGAVNLEKNGEITRAEEAFAMLSPAEQERVSNIDNLRKARDDYSQLRADEIDALIDSIGKVTRNSSAAIAAAEEALDGLTEYEKTFVRGAEILSNARESYLQLLAKEVDDQIDAIGEVTVNSENAIAKAEAAYNELSSEEQVYVAKLEQLKEARSTYNLLKANVVDSLIEAIGEVTLRSGSAIGKAEQELKALTSDQLALVTKADILENAKTTYEAILIANAEQLIDAAFDDPAGIKAAESAYKRLSEDQKGKVRNYEKLTQAKAKVVVDLIEAIGTVTLTSGERIDAADKAYQSLNSEEQEYVTNLQVLTDAKNKLNELEKAEKERRKQELIKKMNTTVDNVSGQTFYEHKSHPKYINTRSYVLPYITFFTKTPSYPSIRIIYDYAGRDWVFFKKVIIVTDADKYTRNFSYFNITRETSYGSNLYECIDVVADKDDIEMLRDIAGSSSVTVSFQGDSHRKDITISSEDQQIIRDILELYDLLNGS